MSVKECCKNCIYFIDGIGEQNCCKNKNATISTPRVFIPKEDVVRKDELEREIEIKNQIDIVLEKGKYTIKTILQIIKLNDDFIGVMEEGFIPIENYPNKNNFNY